MRNLRILDVLVARGTLFALLKKGDNVTLFASDLRLREKYTIGSVAGKVGYLLDTDGESCLLSVDNRLVVCDGGEFTSVLNLASPRNILPHATRIGPRILVQEYGESPTALWLSERGYSGWSRLVSNVLVDRYSRHFHDVGYDCRRRWILATLGDANPVRVIVSSDEGDTWHTLVRGPWQFYPIAILEDRILLGLDSGIANGGVSTYFPDTHRLRTSLLKWRRLAPFKAQMFCLRSLHLNLWAAATSSPATLLVSKDTLRWYVAYLDDSPDRPRSPPRLSYGEGILAFCTGQRLLVSDFSELESLCKGRSPDLVPHLGLVARLKGQAFVVKNWFRERRTPKSS